MSPAPAPRPPGPLRARNVVIAAVLAALALALLVLWKRPERGAPAPREGPAPSVEQHQAPPPGSAAPVGGDVERRWRAWLGHAPQWPARLAEPPCDEIAGEAEALCAAIDDRAELRVAGEGSPCDYLRAALRELAARPPAATDELRDPSTIAANVSHLFRVLGRRRLALLRTLLEEDPDLAEPAAFVIYRWWISRDACEPAGTSAVGLDSFYDYATFGFRSLGGQAYLRRRSPKVEALACFYGLHGLDLADRRGHNPRGFDPSAELDRCRTLLSTQPLDRSADYRRELDAIAERWKAKRLPR